MTKKTSEKCRQCKKPATHWRRYELTRGDGVHEIYFPYCDKCANSSVSASAAPKIPLTEVVR